MRTNIKSGFSLSVILISVMLLIITAMSYMLIIDKQLDKEHFPVIEAAKEIQLQTALAHLWFEEIISGDTVKTYEEVISLIELAEWYANAIITGGTKDKLIIIPIKDKLLQKEIILVQKELKEYKRITIERWSNKYNSEIGSAIDQKYDGVFDAFQEKTLLVEYNIRKYTVEQRNNSHSIQLFLIIISLLLFISLIVIIKNYIKSLENAELTLQKDQLLLENKNNELLSFNEEYETLNDELLQTNEELNAAKAKAEESDLLKTEFINNMSHEIRTPMNGILGFSKMLGKPGKSEEKKKHFVQIIQNSGNQLMRIIDDILEISKLGTKQVTAQNEAICLNDLLLSLFSVFDIKAKENKTPLYLKKGLSDKESTILTDESKLNKILSNLLENALKFTNEGFIEFGYIVDKVHEFSLHDKTLQLYVKDTGIGIAPDKQEAIFERFSQAEKELSRKAGGLGLGLSIAKENAELIGGEITLVSKKGKGSTFYVTIPYNQVDIDTKDQISDTMTQSNKEHTILIVEDEEVNYLYLETALIDEIELDCKILHAKNGQEAVEMCKAKPEIGLVLMDLKMPIMNGFDATKQIKKFRPELLIIAQTAYSTKSEKDEALSAGCDDFISKPIKEETLSDVINKYLGTKN